MFDGYRDVASKRSTKSAERISKTNKKTAPYFKLNEKTIDWIHLWGWKTSKHDLLPVHTNKEAAPEKFLKTMCCTCSKDCLRACSDRKIGMKYITIYKQRKSQ
ncbi:hypothetical protein PR048_006186 [Dryococelus australis]|uniref:Uncharacterized protein n=1 Tax=Dryococelus australis TaxID=614101 RepID=A0ABQ9IB85_9NEOP|nr:hypothetical protein PR048_006186 [Dryococelus australis]